MKNCEIKLPKQNNSLTYRGASGPSGPPGSNMEAFDRINNLKTELESHVETRIDDLNTSSISYVNEKINISKLSTDQSVQDLEAALNETSDTLYNIIHGSRLLNCPVNNSKYAFINDTCYYFEATKLGHSEAATNCLSMFGGRVGVLFEPKTTDINTEVHLKSKEATFVTAGRWIGVVISSDGNKFQYESLAEIVPFSHSNPPWDNGQPGLRNGEDCAIISGEGKWHDYPCSSRFSSICESQGILNHR